MTLRKENWNVVKLGDICSILRGNIITKKTIIEGDIPVIASSVGITYFHNQANRFGAVITISASGVNAGYVNFFDVPIFASDCITIQPLKNGIDLNYIYNYLKLLQGTITAFQRGTAQAHVYPKDLFPLEISLPPIEEQKQIASLFQLIEKAIENAEVQEKCLLELKNNILRDLFSGKQKFENYLKENDYEKVRFDKIAINISKRVEPKKTELKTYVGLEHLDADNLKIDRTGTPEDVIGTKLKIYRGDIIFGKRRAYLRKVAVSHFDGIASAHSMILRADEKNIERDFLPYFMQSDAFMERAIQISEGSLSPTIKWKTLAAQEFIIPTKMKQPKLVKVFHQFDSTTQLLKQQKSILKTLKQNLLKEILG